MGRSSASVRGVAIAIAVAACGRAHYGGPPTSSSVAHPWSSGVTATAAPTSSSPSARAPDTASGCDAIGSGVVYEVGDGKPRTTLASVPWSKLQPGDAVRVFARAEPYREKIHISTSGTAAAPIRICGVPSAAGVLPIIDGDGAVADKTDDAPFGRQQRALVLFSLRADQPDGWKPRYVVLDGFEIRHATDAYKFTDSKGVKRAYLDLAAAVFVERGEHITIRNCVIHDAGNGLFVASGDNEDLQSRDILVEGNSIYGNGTTGKKFDRHHNVYTEALGITFQRNFIGPLREGSGGNAIKDRSAGTIVRYNRIEGGAHSLDLVEPEESSGIAGKDPHLHQTFVYGNIIVVAKTSARPIHYGGDNGDESTYRKGTLFFYDNTVVLTANEKETWSTALFGLETDDESADVRNNLFVSTGTTHVTWASGRGAIKLGVNLTTKPIELGSVYATKRSEKVDGDKQTIVNADPKFVGDDFCLAADSPARGAAGALEPSLAPEFFPRFQYKKPQSSLPRDRFAKGGDLGAVVCP